MESRPKVSPSHTNVFAIRLPAGGRSGRRNDPARSQSDQPDEPTPGSETQTIWTPPVHVVYKPGDSSTHHPDEPILARDGLQSPARRAHACDAKPERTRTITGGGLQAWSPTPGRARVRMQSPCEDGRSRTAVCKPRCGHYTNVKCPPGAATHHVRQIQKYNSENKPPGRPARTPTRGS